MRWLGCLKTKTVLGAVLVAIGRLVPNVEDPQAWVEAIGLVTAALGARHAIAKAATPKPAPPLNSAELAKTTAILVAQELSRRSGAARPPMPSIPPGQL